ncbi:MAG: ParB/RepB/Spo0J family partition protein [Oscillospiraceae bacterium]|jgi:ParB family chromosome partitioning protein|nr:ParB/RepB/Spo0J family partition protein [Oscillospiraceae bacterium]
MAQKNKGLGTGLSELFGEAAYAEYAPTDFEYLPVAKIEPRRGQPRVEFRREPLEELAESVRQFGVLQPLTVRKKDGGVYEIIAGERRWRAARMAGLTDVPARILAVDDRTATELSLVENLQREDLNPIEEALGYKALGEEFRLTHEEIAARMGKSRPAISNAVRLLALPEEVLAYVRDGKLQAGTARALLGIGKRDLLLQIAKEAAAQGLTTREVEKIVRRLNNPTKNVETRKKKPNYTAEIESILSERLGRKIKITNGRGNTGRIEVEYYGNEDFEKLYNGLHSLGED